MSEYFILRADSRKIKRVIEEVGGWTPQMSRWTKPKGKRKPILSQVPIFPTWVFLPFDNDHYHDYKNVAGTRGVLRGSHKKPLILSQEDYEQLHRIEKEWLEDPQNPKEYVETLEIGQKVRVDGVLSGAEGVIQGIKGTQVSVNIGGNYPVSVDCCLVRVLSVY